MKNNLHFCRVSSIFASFFKRKKHEDQVPAILFLHFYSSSLCLRREEINLCLGERECCGFQFLQERYRNIAHKQCFFTEG